MLKVKIDRETMVKAIDWYAKGNHALTPIIDDGDGGDGGFQWVR
jgi:hypothetical protein